MSLFDRLKQMLNPDGKIIKNGDPDALNIADGRDAPSDPPDCGVQTVITLEDKQSKVGKLTPRERDLYLLLLEGFTLKECAKQLSIKYSTANTHMTAIYKKLGVNTRAELIINYRGIDSGKT
ncbi:MAG: helix-turn-helix transcriptional regulator [Dehalobacterium sp.]|jgi:DNA-binding CsgD family transcriptional regulator